MKKSIVLIGMTGCGKTSVGRALSYRLKMPFVDMDHAIEEETGESIPQIFQSQGEPYFRMLETDMAKKLSKMQGTMISTGGGIVLNPINMECLKKNSVVVYINRSVEDIIKNIDTEKRPLLKGGTDRLYTMHEERHPLYMRYADVVVCNRSTFEDGVHNVYEAIQKFVT